MNKIQNVLNPDAAKEALQAKQSSQIQQQQQQPAAGIADMVSFSSKGKDIARIAEQVKETPEIRQDLVAEMKSAIEAGTYKVDSQDLATKMIKEMLMESLL
ncbi:MAG: flagellar biosynthesis anti-sigma factor FlgM [Deltaproteobacteria bacterium]|nr:flagellar biosynthesis anti-sigma factor FlgM [Candidatus Anaeroferrophillus wilburensis]MBN2889608.1 flagellar biosynthesis anti-sigma factor FlgM [Deltaproteobacteria bacterium]